jgi:hypothetical protein
MNILVSLTCICLGVIPLAAWLTHVITCISEATWGFLVAGAIFFPIGMVHGIGIWMGVWP